MKKMGLSSKILLLTSAVVILTAGTAIFLAYRTAFRSLQQAVGTRLAGIAATGSLMINGDMHDKIQYDKDASLPEFIKLRDTLRQIKQINQLDTEIYTLRKISDDRAMKFIVMSNPKSFIGDSYKPPLEVKAAMAQAISGKKSTYTGIYRSENGWWITAYAPIFNSKQQLSGLLNVDIKLTTFYQQLSQTVMPLLFLSGIVLLLGMLASFVFARRLVHRLQYLNQITKDVSLGVANTAIVVDTEDEVGELAQSLERMRISLEQAMQSLERDDD